MGGAPAAAATPTPAADQAAATGPLAPARFLYQYLHDAIRGELAALVAGVAGLEGGGSAHGQADGGSTPPPAPPAAAAASPGAALAAVRVRCRFLTRVYKYHSAVEDEVKRREEESGETRPPQCMLALCLSRAHAPISHQVIYPALDARISNVTPAYTVEHEDEVCVCVCVCVCERERERRRDLPHSLEKKKKKKKTSGTLTYTLHTLRTGTLAG